MGAKESTIGLAAAVIIILGIAVAALHFNIGAAHAIGSPTGVSVLSLSNVGVQGINQGNYSGRYVFADVNLGGSFQPITSSAASLAQQIGNSSYVGSQQIDTISITSLQNKILYTTNGNAGSTVLNTYNLTPYTGSFSYTDCNGQTNLVSGTTKTTVDGCLVGTNTKYLNNYITACQASVSATNHTWIGVPIAAGGQWYPLSDEILQCYAIQPKKWGQVYQLNSGQPNYTIQVGINGKTLTLSNQHTQAFVYNSTGKVLAGAYVNPVQAGGTYFGPPSPQSIGALFVNNTQQRLIQYSSLSNVQTAQVQTNQTVGKYNGVLNTYTLSSVTSALNSANQNLVQTMYLAPQSSYPGLVGRNSSNDLYVTIDDSGFQYYKPSLELVSSASFFGFSLAAASCSLSVSPISFVSGSIGGENVTVTNAGPQGTCVVSASSLPSGFSTSSSQTTKLLQSGQSQTLSFQVFGLQANNGSTQNTAITFSACNALNQGCSTATASVAYLSQCNNTQVLTNGNCQKVQDITVPTTTIPVEANGTTTVPPVTCDPGTVFNQTLYNQHINPPCSPTPVQSGFKVPGWAIAAIIIIIIVIIAAVAMGGRGGRRGR